jgi:uncharacterized protein
MALPAIFLRTGKFMAIRVRYLKTSDRSLKQTEWRMIRFFFSGLLVEPHSGDVESYVNLLKNVLEKKISSFENVFSHDHKTAALTYAVMQNGINYKIIEYIAVHNHQAFRLQFWTLASLFKRKQEGFSLIAGKTKFRSEERNQTASNEMQKNRDGQFQNTDSSYLEKKKNNRYMFFPVKGKKNMVYIMGSIHVGKKNFYPLTEEIENAFATSNNIVVEVNNLSPENRKETQNIIQYLLIENNQTLDNILPADLYERLKAKVLDSGLSMNQFNRLKPWVVATTLVMLRISKQGYSPEFGTEYYFLKRSTGKNIHQLETFREQIEVLNSLNGNAFLNQTLNELESTDGEIKEIVELWRTGNLSGMYNIIFKKSNDASSDAIYKMLYFDRNEKMVEKIKSYLDQSEDYFVIVGSAHLTGDKGILSLLQKAGYTVENLPMESMHSSP